MAIEGQAEDRGDEVSQEAAAALAEAAKSAPADKGAEAPKEDVEGKAAEKAAAVAEETARDEKGRFIPKSRFDEQVGKEREARVAAERQLAELQAQLKTVDANADVAKLEEEIVSLEKAQSKAMLEGDADKAAELATQIRMKERTIQIQESASMSTRAKNEAREEVRMDTAIERLEATYPMLDSKSDTFDQDLVDLVLGTQLQLINTQRMTPSEALTAAAAKVMAKVQPAAKADDGKSVGLGAAKVASDRKEAQVAKNVETARKQPASMKESGMDTDKAGIKGEVDATKLSYEEFAALPEATKSRMRGDLLE